MELSTELKRDLLEIICACFTTNPVNLTTGNIFDKISEFLEESEHFKKEAPDHKTVELNSDTKNQIWNILKGNPSSTTMYNTLIKFIERIRIIRKSEPTIESWYNEPGALIKMNKAERRQLVQTILGAKHFTTANISDVENGRLFKDLLAFFEGWKWNVPNVVDVSFTPMSYNDNYEIIRNQSNEITRLKKENKQLKKKVKKLQKPVKLPPFKLSNRQLNGIARILDNCNFENAVAMDTKTFRDLTELIESFDRPIDYVIDRLRNSVNSEKCTNYGLVDLDYYSGPTS